ncbi:MAG: cytochrome c biogenesis protein CcdA [Thermodesulfovibrionales bacterium]|nr:cytochrome c biogenesis protein CcdA [Thermodesulfovibrionales bacterium]
MLEVSYAMALIAGVMSFLSPCVLPLVPVYISVISGLSYEELRSKGFSLKTLLNTVSFVIGFSSIFVVLGASSSYFGILFIEYQSIIRISGAVLIIVFGLFLMGLIKPQMLLKEKKIHFYNATSTVLGSFILGIVFAAGWTPCIGPILGSILLYTASQASAEEGFKLLAVYSVGLAIPFIISAIMINLFFTYTRRLQRFMSIFSKIMGIVLLIFGVLLLFDKVSYLSAILPGFDVKY